MWDTVGGIAGWCARLGRVARFMFTKERTRFFLRTSFATAGLALFYFWISLLFSVYGSAFKGVLLTCAWGLIFGVVGIYLLKKELSFSKIFWQSLSIIFINSIFGLAIVRLALRYPTLFHRYVFGIDDLVPFLLFLLASASVFYLAFQVYQRFSLPTWLEAPRRFVDEHLWGLALAGIFLISYFVLAILFNRTEFYMIDSLFEGDHSYWLSFFGVDAVHIQPNIRAVHPLVYIFLRPLSWFASLFLHGNMYYATLLVIAATGALAVFLVWLFLHEYGLSQPAALLLASIFGATTTHLLFGAFAESYIFSATAILLLFVLVQRKSTTLKSLVPAGLLVFGITISNIVQTLTALFFVRKNAKLVVRYLLILLLLAVLLNVVNNALYPYESGYFFIPSSLLKEQKYSQSVFDFPAWKLQGRIYATVRNLFFYTVVAPSAFFTLDDPGKPLPRISFFSFSPGQYSHSAYDGFANLILFAWLALLAFSGIHFLWSLRKKKNWNIPQTLFSLALLTNIGFNLFFHIIYGEDPFLYSADWAYALVLFVALSFSRFFEYWWVKAYFFIFLILLMGNNFAFIGRLIDVIAQAI